MSTPWQPILLARAGLPRSEAIDTYLATDGYRPGRGPA